jgi:hypothetical protein
LHHVSSRVGVCARKSSSIKSRLDRNSPARSALELLMWSHSVHVRPASGRLT